jgi:hypothetical protein
MVATPPLADGATFMKPKQNTPTRDARERQRPPATPGNAVGVRPTMAHVLAVAQTLR